MTSISHVTHNPLDLFKIDEVPQCEHNTQDETVKSQAQRMDIQGKILNFPMQGCVALLCRTGCSETSNHLFQKFGCQAWQMLHGTCINGCSQFHKFHRNTGFIQKPFVVVRVPFYQCAHAHKVKQVVLHCALIQAVTVSGFTATRFRAQCC